MKCSMCGSEMDLVNQFVKMIEYRCPRCGHIRRVNRVF